MEAGEKGERGDKGRKENENGERVRERTPKCKEGEGEQREK